MRQLTPRQMVDALGHLASEREWHKELRKTYRAASTVGANAARRAMRSSGDRQLAAAAKGVRAAATPRSAAVNVRLGRSAAAVYGMKRPTGWLAWHRGTTARNNPPWIGEGWRPMVRGEGPRGVNDGLADASDQIQATFETAATDLIDRAMRR